MPARVARGIAGFMLAELGTDEGAFASALDADSEGEEGTFYVWTQAQLVDVLGPDDGAWAAQLLTVTERGTFEGGTSTLQLREQPDDRQRWESCRERLLAARAKRVRPDRDDKVVAAWNGLAISGLVDAGTLLGIPSYVEAAVRCGEFLADHHLEDGRLLRVSRDGVAGTHAGRPRGLRLRRHRVPGAGVRHRRRRLGGSRRRAARHGARRTSRPRTAASTTPPTTQRR